MKRLLLVLAVTFAIPGASAATRAERCEKYNEELARIEEAKKRTTSEARLHKLESKRQKILAGKAKHKC
jgi:enolase